jgi:hypothetical protein
MKKTITLLAVLFSVSFLTIAFRNAGDKKVFLQVTHEVKNYAEWKKGFDADKVNRDKAGIKTIGVYASVDNANLVTILTEAPSAEVAKGFLNNPELKAAMEKLGVISAPEVKILTKME